MRASPAATLIQEYRRAHSGIGLEGLELAPLNTRHYRVFSDLPG
jgi:hypothetical protein